MRARWVLAATAATVALLGAGAVGLLVLLHAGAVGEKGTPAPTGGSAGAAPASAGPTFSTGSPVPVAQLKPLITGLLYRDGKPPADLRSGLAGYDVEGSGQFGAVSWAQLQSAPGGPITLDNPIDQAITDVDAWNAANPQDPELLKVRILAGIHSPAWAMNLGGPCVEVRDPNFGTTGCTPRFWTPAFAAAFYQFEAELAARYDNVPVVAEVVISRDMTIYNEPLLRQIADPTTVANLLAAGYSTALDEANQLADMRALATYWKHTRVGFAFNPYQTLDPSGTDEAFTAQLMAYGRSLLGDQLVLENDSLRQAYVTGTGDYQAMYASMQRLGAPMAFQTAVLSKVGSLAATIQGAATWGASSIELPSGYQAQLSQDQVAILGSALTASATPAASPG